MATMNTQSIQEINGLPDAAPVYKFTGTATAVYDRKTGGEGEKQWSVQNCQLRDANGEIIKAVFWGKDELPFKAGDTVELENYKGPKGFSGLYAHDDEYQGTITRKLKATATCQIHVQGQQATSSPPPQQQQPPAQQGPPQEAPAGTDLDSMPDQNWGNEQATSQPPAQSAPPAKKTATDDFKRARKALVQLANLHLTCAMAVHRVEMPAYEKATGRPMTGEQVQAAISSIYISADRRGMLDDMPASPLKADDFNH